MGSVIGISDTHNASAAALDEDSRLLALQEERPTRIKNFSGFPVESIRWLLAELGRAPGKIDHVALAGQHRPPFRSREEILRDYRDLGNLKSQIKRLLRPTPVYSAKQRMTQRERVNALTAIGFRRDTIHFHEHHLCHAATAYYGQGNYDEPVLVLTCDGGGDGLCATVSVGREGALERLESIEWSESIAVLYAMVTYLMGMVPLEHEYKIMGMAPYAKASSAERIAKRLEELFVWPDDGSPCWRRAEGVPHMFYAKPALEEIFFEQRFDSIMAGTQLFTERMLCEFVRRAIARTGVRSVALAGGIFMNVKANKEILALPELEKLFVFPSCGDETNAIGACYLARVEEGRWRDIEPIGPFYLGPDWSDDSIREVFEARASHGEGLRCERFDDINAEAAKLLASGQVVARFSGREEFGARSLGNRAILADPRNPEIVPVINEMIKNRDFWMPFAASIMDDYAPSYLENPKRAESPYMILSFDTTKEGSESMRAGVHPYDRSCRPQVVSREQNPAYWDLLDKFRELTGTGGVLNTSLNLHGLPIAHTPADAVEVLEKSGLRHLVCGNWILSKAAEN